MILLQFWTVSLALASSTVYTRPILGARCRPIWKPPSRCKFIIPVRASQLGTHQLLVKSISEVHLHWSRTIHNIASAVSDVIVVCWIFCSLSNKSCAFLGAVHKYGKEISAFVIVYCCYWCSVKEFDDLEADAWDGEHLTESWCLKGKLCWNYEF